MDHRREENCGTLPVHQKGIEGVVDSPKLVDAEIHPRPIHRTGLQ